MFSYGSLHSHGIVNRMSDSHIRGLCVSSRSSAGSEVRQNFQELMDGQTQLDAIDTGTGGDGQRSPPGANGTADTADNRRYLKDVTELSPEVSMLTASL